MDIVSLSIERPFWQETELVTCPLFQSPSAVALCSNLCLPKFKFFQTRTRLSSPNEGPEGP